MTAPTASPSLVSTPRSLAEMAFTAVVVAAAVVVGAYLVLTGESTPRVTFDGETATYDGPTSFDAGEQRFVFDNRNSDVDVAFALFVVTDLTMTEADLTAGIAEGAIDSRPSFLDPFRGKVFWANQDNPEDRIRDETVLLDADTRYVIYVLTDRWEIVPDQFVAVFEVR